MLLVKAGPTQLLLKGKREHSPVHSGTSYTLESMGCGDFKNKWQERYNKALEILRCHDFDAIAFSGYSGCLVASMLARDLDKTMILVRKKREDEGASHTSYRCEGDYGAESYVIVDDFYCSGSTVRHIVKSILHDIGTHVKCIGQIQFHYPMDKLEPLSACLSESLMKELNGYWNGPAQLQVLPPDPAVTQCPPPSPCADPAGILSADNPVGGYAPVKYEFKYSSTPAPNEGFPMFQHRPLSPVDEIDRLLAEVEKQD